MMRFLGRAILCQAHWVIFRTRHDDRIASQIKGEPITRFIGLYQRPLPEMLMSHIIAMIGLCLMKTVQMARHHCVQSLLAVWLLPRQASVKYVMAGLLAGCQNLSSGATDLSSDPLAAPWRPAHGVQVTQTPPDFSWPAHSRALGYELLLLPEQGGAQQISTTHNWALWPKMLAPGEYTWQIGVRLDKEQPVQWGAAHRFRITDTAQSFVVPAPPEIWNTATGRARPRGFPRGAEHAALSAALLEGERKEAFKTLQARVLRRAAEPLAALSPTQMSTPNRRARALKQLALPAQIAPDLQQTLEAAFLWQLLGETEYLTQARRRALGLASLDPHGVTGYHSQDQLTREIAWTLALAYDWLYPALSVKDRQTLLQAVVARQRTLIAALFDAQRPLAAFPYDSHRATTLGYAAAIAALIAGDVPAEDDQLAQLLPLYAQSVSPWGGEDGGFANGTDYAQWALDQLLVWDVLRYAVGIDFYRKPWVSNLGRYFLYFLPPGAQVGVFGDGAERSPSPLYLRAYLSRFDDPLYNWYAQSLPPSDASHLWLLLAPPLARAVPHAMPTVPDAGYFPSIGWIAMHSRLADENRYSIYFKSSAYGSYNHSHADQNSFVIHARGHALAIDSGVYDWYGSPHWRQWYKQTRAHNAITFDGGQGQVIDERRARGEITHFAHTPQADIARGDATAAYGGTLTKAHRTLVYLRPATVLVFDSLASEVPRRWEWNLHALTSMSLQERHARINHPDAALCVEMLNAPPGQFTQTNRYTAAPDAARSRAPTQWHAQYAVREKTTSAIFLALLRLDCATADVAVTQQDSNIAVKIDTQRVIFDAAGNAALQP